VVKSLARRRAAAFSLVKMANEPWSDQENDLIVADYFAMLADDISRRAYSKAEHNRRMQEGIARSRKSIEFKLQNVSAVLKALGEEWNPGFRPAFHFQASLVDAVLRWFALNPSWLERTSITRQTSGFEEPSTVWVAPPPTLSNEPPPSELEQTIHIARKFDVAGRDERNRALGRAGEERVLEHEHAVLISASRHDLARKIRWAAKEEGDGLGYDIASFTPDGQSRLIEVKTTNGWERTPFEITRNELAVAERKRNEWCLFRLWNFAREPRAFELYPPLDAHVTLTALTFQASFN
jgi:hypothetical protein